MAFLHEFDAYADYYGFTESEKKAYISMYYLDLALYGMLILLAIRNIIVILVMQREYRNLPVLAFYEFSFLAVSLRPAYLIGLWTSKYYVFYNIDWVQQGSKLCVGIVQDWITLELAIRIHHARGYSDISEAAKKKLRSVFKVLWTILTLAFLAWSCSVLVSARKEEDVGEAYKG